MGNLPVEVRHSSVQREQENSPPGGRPVETAKGRKKFRDTVGGNGIKTKENRISRPTRDRLDGAGVVIRGTKGEARAGGPAINSTPGPKQVGIKRGEGSSRKGGGVCKKGVWGNSMPNQQPISQKLHPTIRTNSEAADPLH